MTRVLVVGNGMVGSRFADELLAEDAEGRFTVTILGAEDVATYNRVLLSDVVAGRYQPTEIGLPSLPHERLTVREGVSVTSVDRADRSVTTASGERVRYDFLVLATGAAPRVPPVPGLGGGDPRHLPAGAHPLRSLGDATAIVAAAGTTSRAVVLGGGVLGVEIATGLHRRGLDVSLVHPADGLMDRQLTPAAAQALDRSLGLLGVDRRLGASAVEVLSTHPEDSTRPVVTGLRLGTGEVLPADLLVLATGTTPDIMLAASCGLATRRGVVVDEDGRTSDPRVFAVGDCAEPPGGASGLVGQGWGQARALTRHLVAGSRAGTTSPAPDDVVRVKAHGLDIVTMGTIAAAPARARTVTLSDPEAGRHVEVTVAGDQLVGATCVGSPDVAADLVIAYTRRTPVPADPARLLLTALATAPPSPDVTSLADDAVVCRCSTVTKGAICSAVHGGATSVVEVATTTRATTGCGSCREDVCALLALAGPPETAEPPTDRVRTPADRHR